MTHYVIQLPTGGYAMRLNERVVESTKNAATRFETMTAALLFLETHQLDGKVEPA